MKEELPYIFYFSLMVITFAFVAYSNKTKAVSADKTEQAIQQIQETKQTKIINIYDSINVRQ